MFGKKSVPKIDNITLNQLQEGQTWFDKEFSRLKAEAPFPVAFTLTFNLQRKLAHEQTRLCKENIRLRFNREVRITNDTSFPYLIGTIVVYLGAAMFGKGYLPPALNDAALMGFLATSLLGRKGYRVYKQNTIKEAHPALKEQFNGFSSALNAFGAEVEERHGAALLTVRESILAFAPALKERLDAIALKEAEKEAQRTAFQTGLTHAVTVPSARLKLTPRKTQPTGHRP